MGIDVYLYVLKDGWIIDKHWLGMRGTWDKMHSLEDTLITMHRERGFICYELREPKRLVEMIRSEMPDKFGYADAPENFELIKLLSISGCKYEILLEC